PVSFFKVLFFISCYIPFAISQIRYSIPEEMSKGSLVGNIAQDLGLDLKRLKSGKARIYTGDNVEYIELNKERGVILIKERIDREALCGQTTPCALHFQIILENPMQLYRVTVEVTDINDNAPMFSKAEMRFEINELSSSGARFILERAIDHDVGRNGLQIVYFLHFYYSNYYSLFLLVSLFCTAKNKKNKKCYASSRRLFIYLF
uniref:Cadherin domain-containing protein n=1 Tax=Sinocyclocheilus rhinocerous TaxID=307959 RepID=A0A673G7H3_9TELE